MIDELEIRLAPANTLDVELQDQETLDVQLTAPVAYTGTTNYNLLGNKPQINGVTLQGNKTAQELNLVHRAGDSMTGVLVVPNIVSKYGIEFQNAGGTNVGAVCQDMSNNNNQVYVDEYTAAGKRECYLFPAPTATEPTFHEILTSKNAVTIAQGGTGATTASDARENLGAVAKTGDTLTGNLGMPKATLIAPNVDLSTAPSAQKQDDVIFVTDKDGDSAGILRLAQTTGNREDLEFGARRLIGADTRFNTIKFSIDSAGNRSITLSNPAMWRNTLGLRLIKKSTSVNSSIAAQSQLYVYTNTETNYTCVSNWFENDSGDVVLIISNPFLNSGQWVTRIYNPGTSAVTAKGTMYYMFVPTASLEAP